MTSTTTARTVTRSVTDHFVVQHRLRADDEGWPEAQPHADPATAFQEMEAHASHYAPGNIRVVRKVTVTEVTVEVTELVREETDPAIAA